METATAPTDVLGDLVRNIVREELEKRTPANEIGLVPMAKACQILQMHRSTVWLHVKQGRLRAKKIGARIFLYADDINGTKA